MGNSTFRDKFGDYHMQHINNLRIESSVCVSGDNLSKKISVIQKGRAKIILHITEGFRDCCIQYFLSFCFNWKRI